MSEWTRSSFCADKTCVEVRKINDVFQVRNSKYPDGQSLVLTEVEWRAFVKGVQAGEFG